MKASDHFDYMMHTFGRPECLALIQVVNWNMAQRNTCLPGRLQVEQVDGGFQVSLITATGECLMTSELYDSREAAQDAGRVAAAVAKSCMVNEA